MNPSTFDWGNNDNGLLNKYRNLSSIYTYLLMYYLNAIAVTQVPSAVTFDQIYYFRQILNEKCCKNRQFDDGHIFFSTLVKGSKFDQT